MGAHTACQHCLYKLLTSREQHHFWFRHNLKVSLRRNKPHRGVLSFHGEKPMGRSFFGPANRSEKTKGRDKSRPCKQVEPGWAICSIAQPLLL